MSAEALATIRVTGSALPGDVLSAVVAGADGLGGLDADAYRLELGVSPREAANRAWSVLTGAYGGYRKALADRPEGDPAVGLTREKWLAIVLRELGFGRVPTTPAGGLSADDRQFPISHQWDTEAGHVPIHLLGWGVELDKRTPGQAGAADRAPHAMLQEYLNRTDAALWGVVSNGRRLRLLRDSSTLIGQSFVEFDLEAMFDGEVFSDFVVCYLVCHATRFETRNPDGTYADDPTAADCWLERWRNYAVETGTRALTALSPGVKRAIEALGTGFLRHPSNDLHRRLLNQELSPADVHHALLRLAYRLLFCFVAEDRGLLLDPTAPGVARQRYRDWFSTSRLRRIATRRHGSSHGDLWQSLLLVLDGLASEGGRPELALPGLGGIFESPEDDPLHLAEIANDWLLEAVRHLVVFRPVAGGPQRRVNYRNLGAEELGSVYESLLEYDATYNPSDRQFLLATSADNQRRSTGAFYTPTSIIDAVLDISLDPLLDDAEKADDPERALLALTVCDPACGSGHFLVAAARRIAARLASVRERLSTDQAGPYSERMAMHEVVQRCIYGVDLNPMAAELARVSLFLEGMEPGKPLGFLDAHIKVGNALIGATPSGVASGIPDEAFKPTADDDASTARSLSRRNREERAGQADLFAGALPLSNAELASAMKSVLSLPANDLGDIHEIERRYRELDGSEFIQRQRRVADTWCSAFLAQKAPGAVPITQRLLSAAVSSTREQRDGLGASPFEVVQRLGRSYRYFHWHLEFPEVFNVPDEPAAVGSGWEGGFSCVVGNPPFLSPLVASGAKVSPERRLTKTVFSGLGGPKADESSYFLLLASAIVATEGRIGLVLPDSFLSASDSSDIRRALGDRHDLAAIWRGDGSEFEAAVTTIFVVLSPPGSVQSPARFIGPEFREIPGADLPWRESSWAPLVSDEIESARIFTLESNRTLSEFCEISADYRDQYYGLVGAVYDASPECPANPADPVLITTGLIDPLTIAWGETTTKFNKMTYQAPRVALSKLTPEMARWATSRLRPKLMVATQGRMLEVAIDRDGRMLPCVPVICVFPMAGSPVTLEALAAILLSPAAFEYLRLTKLGSGLGSGAIKVSAADLRQLPVPAGLEEVTRAAELLPRLREVEQREQFRILMNHAFEVESALGDAWDETLLYYFGRSAA
jgi:hypothetical protein